MSGRPSLTVHDPGRTLLRRGLRVAVLAPAVFYLFVVVLDRPAAGLPAAFATFSILAFADFGGPLAQRFQGNLLLGLTGTVLFVIGAYAGTVPWVAATATFVVVFAISFTSILRGYFGAASTALLVPWVLAVTTHVPHHLITTKAMGWAVGALVATVGAAVLWPSHPRSRLRQALAACLDEAAGLVVELADDPRGPVAQASWRRFTESIDNLHAHYNGRLVRPGVGTTRDRSLMLAYDQLHRLRTMLHAWHDAPPEPTLRAADKALTQSVAATLRESAICLRRGYGITGAEALDDARDRHERDLLAWSEGVHDDPAVFRSQAHAAFPARVTSLATQLLAVYVQGALDTTDRIIGRRAARERPTAVTFVGEVIIDPSRVTPARDLLTAQLRLDSPWLRTALRTAVALTLTVVVVEVTRAENGFWVSLGALVALKIDAAGTRSTAGSVFVGTVVGFVIASVLVFSVDLHSGIFWALLPLAAFLAAYTLGAISLSAGQASFTVFILLMFAIESPSLKTGVIRLVDVGMGLAVSLAVSALIWPRGIIPMVNSALHRQAVVVGDFLVAAFARLVEGPVVQDTLVEARERSRHELAVAEETFDLALAQVDAAQAHRVPVWTTTLNCTTQMNFIAGVVGVLEKIDPLPVPPASGDAMLALAHHVQADIARSTHRLGQPAQTSAAPDSLDRDIAMDRLWGLVDEDLRQLWAASGPTRERGSAALVLVFAASWLARCLWLAERLSRRIDRDAGAQPVPVDAGDAAHPR